VIPSGVMLGIPVEALPLAERGPYVGDRFAVSYVPSATIQSWLREKEAEGRWGSVNTREHDRSTPPILAIGDPPFSPDHLRSTASESASPPAASASSPFLLTSELRALSPTDGETLVRSALAGNREILLSLKRLPSTRQEATLIAQLYPEEARLLLGGEATEQELVRMAEEGELRRCRILHIATHALVDDERPENSALILSQVGLPDPLEAALNGTRIYDGCLSAGEIVREWKLDADLLTLSACETALGKRVAGEGYIGFAHAFLQVGARALLVSLWEVEDRSTAMLMRRFYENQRGGYAGVRDAGLTRDPGAPLPKAAALQEAKRWLREWTNPQGSRPYQHPYYWAGFVLIGSVD